MNTEFGPNHPTHRRVSWPTHLEDVTIQFPSSFIQFLSHNTALPTSEVDKIKELRTEIHERIQDLNDQPAHADSGDEHKRLAKQHFAFGVILAPFRRFNPDILYEVTQHLPVYKSYTGRKKGWLDSNFPGRCDPELDNVEVTHIPTILSQVSALWRDVVHGMPRVWGRVRLCPENTTLVLERQLQHFGGLSASAPFTIKILGLLDSHHLDGAQLLSWILYSWKDGNRPRTLHIDSGNLAALLHVANSSNNKGSALQIQTCRLDECEVSWQTLTEFLDIPGLDVRGLWILDTYTEGHFWRRDLALDNPLALPEDMHNFRSWSNLTRFYVDEVHEIGMDAFWGLLQICPRLEVASFPIYLAEEPNTLKVSKTIVHHHLKELGLDLFLPTAMNVYSVLSRCRFPAVTSLHLVTSEHTCEPIGVPHPSDAAQIFPSLKTFFILDFTTPFAVIDWMQFDTILYPLSTITDFTIVLDKHSDSSSFEDMIESLTQPSERIYNSVGPAVKSYLAPKLANLNIYNCEWDRSDWTKHHPIFAILTKLKKLRPSIVISLNLVGSEESSVQRYFSDLQDTIKEVGVDIDYVQVTETIASYGPQPDTLRDYFLQYFR